MSWARRAGLITGDVSAIAVVGVGIAAGGVGGFLGGAAQSATQQLIDTRTVDSSKVREAALLGGAVGAVTGGIAFGLPALAGAFRNLPPSSGAPALAFAGAGGRAGGLAIPTGSSIARALAQPFPITSIAARNIALRGSALVSSAVSAQITVVQAARGPTGATRASTPSTSSGRTQKQQPASTRAKERSSLPPELRDLFLRGQQFNVQNRPRIPFNEVEVIDEETRQLFRVDSYNPGVEIVSRKLTQFADVQEETALRYLREALRKYPPGAKITDSPFNAAVLRGDRLQGQLILEVPVQVRPVPPRILEFAKENDITIRDVSGRAYN